MTVFAPVADALCLPALSTPFGRQHSVLNVGVSETGAGPTRVLESSRSAATISTGSTKCLGACQGVCVHLPSDLRHALQSASCVRQLWARTPLRHPSEKSQPDFSSLHILSTLPKPQDPNALQQSRHSSPALGGASFGSHRAIIFSSYRMHLATCCHLIHLKKTLKTV